MGEEKEDADTDTNSAEDSSNSSNSSTNKNKKKSSKRLRKKEKKTTTPTDESDENDNSNEGSESTSTNSSEKTTSNSSDKSNSKDQDKPLLEANTKEEEKGDAAAGGEDKKDEDADDKTEQTQFRVATASSGNEFKLRIVPLEKLLASPKTPETLSLPSSSSKRSKPEREAQEREQRKRLPQRSNRKSVSIIELSETEESTDEDDIIVIKSGSNSTTKTTAQAAATTSAVRAASPATTKKIVSTSKPGGAELKRVSEKVSEKKNSNKPREAQPPSSSSRCAKRCIVRIKRLKAQEIKAATNDAAAASANRNNQKTTQNMNGKQRTSNRTASSSASSSSALLVASDAAKLKEIGSDNDSDSDFHVKNEPKSSSSSKRNNKIDRISDNDSDVVASGIASSDAASANSSDSEIIPVRKKRVFNKRKKSSDQDSDFEPKEDEKQKKKKRRVKRNSSGDSDNSDDDDDDEKKKNARKHIRKIIKTKDLDISTKTAAKDEEERRRRIEERQKLYNQIYTKPDSIEVDELVLDFDEETKEPLLQVDAGLLKRLKPHQVTGVKFMWDACFETLQDTQDEEKPGSGCILAHCMGLGKTLQIVALAHTLLSNSRRTHIERVLVISPLSTLTNWAREFKHWMGFARKKNIEIYDLSKYKDKPTRIFKLNEWYEEGGVCILGYDMYRILANDKAKGLKKKQRETLQKALVDPGADLVVCDEGHLLKNEKTSISKAVNKMRTKRRIVLTGTPLQNNLKEYYCMIQFIKPNLLGTYKEYLNRFVNPISNGQYTDSTERDIRLMKHRSHILHQMMQGCIQRRDYSVLAPYLPPKHEYVVYTSLTELQQELYEFYMTVQRDLSSSDMGGKGARLFQDFQELRRIWTHPMSLRVNSDNAIRKRVLANESDSMEDFICDDDDDDDVKSLGGSGSASDASDIDSSKSFASGAGGGSGRGKSAKSGGGLKSRKTRNNKNVDGSGDMEFATLSTAAEEQDDPSEWWKRFVDEKELNNLHHSAKLMILMRLLQQCEVIGDKLLLFSQSLQSLDVIEHFLSLIDSKTKGYDVEGDVGDFKGVWTPGKDYFRLDGSCSVESRESMCKQFNNTSNIRARLFLISTRAGGLGINLVAANRAVIFDVSWNPSHDTQSIFRVYRFGQTKPCYIYRLIAMGTMEQKVYERQVAKQATAKRVIDEQQISRHYNQSDLQELYTYELRPSTEREIPILPKDRLFAELLSELETLLFKYHEHDSLLENEESENLSEAERKAAWSEYEEEKTRTVQTAQYMSYDRNAFGAQFGNAGGSVTSNKIFGFRSDVLLQLLNMKIAKDHVELTQNQVIQLVPSYLQRLYGEMNNGDPTMYKDLLELHATLTHPSGMYMSPLLYANQNSGAAGYYQAGAGPPPPPAAGPLALQQPAQPASGFDPDQVYEID